MLYDFMLQGTPYVFHYVGNVPLLDLAPGLHRLRVVPVGCAQGQARTFRFTV